jgi:hypothetical protein
MTVRRSSKLRVTDPEALAARLPDDLRTLRPTSDSRDFRAHAGRIAEWLNTQQPGLGHLTPAVMAAAGLTASAWFRQSLAIKPPELDWPGRTAKPSPVNAISTGPESPEDESREPSTWVYDPVLTVPPRSLPRVVITEPM